MLDGAFMPISLQNGSTAAPYGRPPERRGFQRRAASVSATSSSPFEQAGAAARIDLEAVPLAGRRSDRLLLEVDADPAGSLGAFDLRGKAVDDRLVDHNRQDSVLKAVGKENIAEPRADDGADAQLLQRPHRPFAGRAAAEIRTCDRGFPPAGRARGSE
jgi:hypothetical protein